MGAMPSALAPGPDGASHVRVYGTRTHIQAKHVLDPRLYLFMAPEVAPLVVVLHPLPRSGRFRMARGGNLRPVAASHGMYVQEFPLLARSGEARVRRVGLRSGGPSAGGSASQSGSGSGSGSDSVTPSRTKQQVFSELKRHKRAHRDHKELFRAVCGRLMLLSGGGGPNGRGSGLSGREHVKVASRLVRTRPPALCGDGFVRVGDAAALMDPISGFGLWAALASGRLAAEALSASLAARDPTQAFLEAHYAAAVRRALGRAGRLRATLASLIRRVASLRTSLPRLMKTPGSGIPDRWARRAIAFYLGDGSPMRLVDLGILWCQLAHQVCFHTSSNPRPPRVRIPLPLLPTNPLQDASYGLPPDQALTLGASYRRRDAPNHPNSGRATPGRHTQDGRGRTGQH